MQKNLLRFTRNHAETRKVERENIGSGTVHIINSIIRILFFALLYNIIFSGGFMDFILFGANIRKERKKQGLTIEHLAEKADIGENFLGKIERGEGFPSLPTAVNIAFALGMGLDALIFYDNYENNKDTYIKTLFGINTLSEEKQIQFIDFLNSNIKYFK
jgi:transcriptional regulator with XRE-family HTH domain